MQNANQPIHPLLVENTLTPIVSRTPARKISDHLVSPITSAKLKRKLEQHLDYVSHWRLDIRSSYDRVTGVHNDGSHCNSWYPGLESDGCFMHISLWFSPIWEEGEYEKISTNCFGTRSLRKSKELEKEGDTNPHKRQLVSKQDNESPKKRTCGRVCCCLGCGKDMDKCPIQCRNEMM